MPGPAAFYEAKNALAEHSDEAATHRVVSAVPPRPMCGGHEVEVQGCRMIFMNSR
jgi:hypothetical protein